MSERNRWDTDAALVVEERFAIVPEWLLDADLSDCAVRLYAVLLRYGQSSGARIPSRSILANRLHKRSVDTVDRAMRELVELGAVSVRARFSGRARLTNAYQVRTSRPLLEDQVDIDVPVPFVPVDGGRTDAATPAAPLRHHSQLLTDSEPPPPPAAALCGITDWAAFLTQVLARRRSAGQPTARWSAQCVDAALQLAVRGRGWPAERARRALLTVAADPATRSPMRVAEAGPWWDEVRAGVSTSKPTAEVEEAERVLADVGGLRVVLQQRARTQLADEGLAVTRASVALRARQLLEQHTADPGDHA